MFSKLALMVSFDTPFAKIGGMVDSTAGKSLVDLAFGCAIAGLAFVAIAFSIGGNRMRQMAKSHLLWIFAGIAIAAAVGGIVNWMRHTGGQQVFGSNGGQTILPLLHDGKAQLMSILPFK